MAYWVSNAKNDTKPDWRQFYCDSEADVKNLPTSIKEGVEQDIDFTAHRKCAIGSECVTLSNVGIYILNSANEWIKLA